MIRPGIVVLLAAAMMLTSCAPSSMGGCGNRMGPYLGGRPCSEPSTLKTGSIRGFIFGSQGASQPVPLALVTTGTISSFTGNPIDAEAVNQEVDDGRTVVVSHDFGDGKGQVLAERRLRTKPILISEQEDPNPTRRAMKQEYVYLRAGEFLLEGVPEGISTVYASFGNVTSAQNPVTVFANTTVTDVNINLLVPMPVSGIEDESIHIATAVGDTPAVDVALAPSTSTSEPWTASPDTVSVALQAPARSGGVVITGLELSYHWMEGRQARTVTIERLPIAPKVVPAAQPSAVGPAVLIPVPVLTEPVIDMAPTVDTSGLSVRVQVRFFDESGFHVQDLGAEPLVTEFQLQLRRPGRLSA